MAQRTPTIGAPTKADQRRAMAEARKGDDLLDEVYRMGKADGKAEARPSSRSAPKNRKRRSTSRRRRPRTNRSFRKGVTSVAGPAAADLTSGMQLVGAVFGLLLLYLVLTNSTAATGAIAALRRGVEWLASPTTSIPYRPS
jgi:hypothetical protein